MKTKSKIQLNCIIGLTILLTACNQMSEQIIDNNAGLNGGFETSKNGLPVNWLLYTSNTVPKADFEISFDKENFKEGKQSLRFDVNECEDIGGWHSPGLTNEFFEVGKYNGQARYKLSFWIKNDGSKYRIKAGGVAPMEGNMKILIESDQQIEDWRYQDYEISVPKDWHLRMELNIFGARHLLD